MDTPVYRCECACKCSPFSVTVPNLICSCTNCFPKHYTTIFSRMDFLKKSCYELNQTETEMAFAAEKMCC